MTETNQAQATTACAVQRPQLYSRWMIGVLIVFAVCEGFLFVWGNEAAHFAWIGLFCAIVFAAARYVRVFTSWRSFFIVLAILIVVALLLFPALQEVRKCSRRLACQYQLKQLGLAIYNYQDSHGQFPPAFVADESGHPMHSWRTAILPCVELQKLYEEYDLKQPWNSPANQALAAKSPIDMFQCPSAPVSPDQPTHRTDYVAVVGPDTLWPPDGASRTLEDLLAPSRTAIVIEINDSDIQWHEPRDVTLDDLLSGKRPWSEITMHSSKTAFTTTKQGRHVLFADGSIHFIPSDLTADQLRRLFSITNPFTSEELKSLKAPHPIVFRHVVYYLWLVTLFLQFVYIFWPLEYRTTDG